MSDSLQPHGLQQARLPCHYLSEFAQTHVHWVSDSIQPFHPVFPFSFCPKSFPLFGSSPMTWLFASGGQNIRASAYQSLCFRNGDTFQGLKWGSCPTLRNELSKEMHVLTKQEIFIGKGTRVESRRVREPRGTALPHGLQSQFYGDGISFRVVFGQPFWLRVFPGGARLVQPRWMPERRILGGGWTYGVSSWPFLNSSGWWWLISSMFLTRISCWDTTHANG